MRWVWAAAGGILLSASLFSARAASQAAPAQAREPAGVAAHAALVNQNCLSCHNDKARIAGLSLQGLSLTDVPANGAVWEKVLRKVRSGDMPPPTARNRPAPAAALAVVACVFARGPTGVCVSPARRALASARHAHAPTADVAVSEPASPPFTLLADAHKAVIRMYEVSGPLGIGVRRVTYLIDQARNIRDVVLADFRISRHEEFARKAMALSRGHS